MTGYTRADTTNQISNGQIADANILDAEYDAIQAAFSAGSGHSHNGATGEGAPILVIGPAQDFVATSTALNPKANSVYDLGATGARFRDLFMSRDIDVAGSVRIGTGLVIGGTTVGANATELNILDGATVSTAELNLLDGALVTTVEINYLQGATSNIQAQLNQLALDIQAVVADALQVTGAASTVVSADLTADRVVISNGAGKIVASGVTTSELNNLSGVNTNGSQGFIPSGGIIMWSGSTAAIPSGWALCNGANGTPDLRGRMVIGAGGAYAVGATGGSASVTLSVANLPSHTHSFSATTSGHSNDHTHGFSGTTSAAGAHTHSTMHTQSGNVFGYDSFTHSGLFIQTTGTAQVLQAALTSGIGNHTHTFSGTTTGSSSDHTHTVSGTTGSTGSGSSFSILNPYYALAYIMKL